MPKEKENCASRKSQSKTGFQIGGTLNGQWPHRLPALGRRDAYPGQWLFLAIHRYHAPDAVKTTVHPAQNQIKKVAGK